MDKLEAVLLKIYSGSKPAGRWLNGPAQEECQPDAPGATWCPYDEEDQTRWLETICDLIEGVIDIPEEVARAIPHE